MEQEPKDKLQIDKERAEKHFIDVCKREGIRHGSKKYFEWQRMYFCGAMTMANQQVSYWAVCLMTSRPIVEKW